MTFCPDCGQEIPSDLFVAHRANEHPPALISVSVPGIATAERFGYQTDPEGDTEP